MHLLDRLRDHITAGYEGPLKDAVMAGFEQGLLWGGGLVLLAFVLVMWYRHCGERK